MGLTVGFNVTGEGISLLLLPRIETRILRRAARGLVTLQTELLRLLLFVCFYFLSVRDLHTYLLPSCPKYVRKFGTTYRLHCVVTNKMTF
jgi:hypothetical protein